MVDDANVAPRGGGCKVLVIGASGGVGTMAVELARRAAGRDATIVAVCSGRNADLVRGLGADEVRSTNLPQTYGMVALTIFG